MSRVSGSYQDAIRVALGVLLGVEMAMAWAIIGSPAPPIRPPLSIAVVGDQNTAGMNNRVVWPTLMAERTGWSVSNYALPETGFAVDGRGGQAFRYQVERAQAGHPQIILLVAGTADASVQEMEAVTVGAVDAINEIIRGGEQAAVVGPIWYETPVPDSIWRVNDAVQKVAEVAGVPYFNTIDPPLLTMDLMHPDLSGPSDEGQSVIAAKITAWLRDQVVQ